MKPNAIIVLDLENTQTHNCLNYILNIFRRKFEIIKILGFGNIFYPKKYLNEFITKDFLINLYKHKEKHFKKRLIPLLKCLFLINNIDCVFMDNDIGENAADNNINNYIETDILQNKQKYSNTTIILFSQDGDFKNILDKLTQNDISNLVIASPNEYYQHWENLGQYRFEFNINKLLENKGKYLNDFHNLICEIKKTQNQQNCQHLTNIDKIFYRLKVDLIKYKNKPRNLNALENHVNYPPPERWWASYKNSPGSVNRNINYDK